MKFTHTGLANDQSRKPVEPYQAHRGHQEGFGAGNFSETDPD